MKPTSRTMLFFALLLLLGSVVFGQESPAADGHVEDDLGFWAPVTLILPLDERKRLSAWVQVEPRLDDNLRGMHQLIVLPGVSYQLKDWIALEGAYGYFPGWPESGGMLWEHRLIQQTTLSKKFGKLKTVLRARIEERFIETAEDPSVRNRYRLLLEHPIKHSPWYITGFDEFFINLNSPENGPKAGYDQNRVYLGIGRYLGKKRLAQVDGGYQLVHQNFRGHPDLFRHIIMLRVSAKLR